MLVDTSGLLAYFDASEPRHADVTNVIDSFEGRCTVSPFVLAELDYLVATRFGVAAELAVLGQFAAGAFDVAPISTAALGEAMEVIDKYADQQIGLADAHQVVLARDLGTRTILTLDRRHFDVLRPLQGGRFAVSPR